MPYILCVEGNNVGEEWFVGTSPLTFGRNQFAGAAIYDTKVSREHARVFLKGSRHFIEDLGSTNGTWVESEKIHKPTSLSNEDFFQVGQSLFLFTNSSLRERVERQRYQIGDAVMGTTEGFRLAMTGALHEMVQDVIRRKQVHVRHSRKVRPGSFRWLLMGLDALTDEEGGETQPRDGGRKKL